MTKDEDERFARNWKQINEEVGNANLGCSESQGWPLACPFERPYHCPLSLQVFGNDTLNRRIKNRGFYL